MPVQLTELQVLAAGSGTSLEASKVCRASTRSTQNTPFLCKLQAFPSAENFRRGRIEGP